MSAGEDECNGLKTIRTRPIHRERFNELCMWLMSIWHPFCCPAICTSICTSFAIHVCQFFREIWPSAGLRPMVYGIRYTVWCMPHTYTNGRASVAPAASIPFNAAISFAFWARCYFALSVLGFMLIIRPVAAATAGHMPPGRCDSAYSWPRQRRTS